MNLENVTQAMEEKWGAPDWSLDRVPLSGRSSDNGSFRSQPKVLAKKMLPA